MTNDDRQTADATTTAPRTPKAPKAPKAPRPGVPAGYEVKYPHRTYLLVKTGANADEAASKILVMCRVHGTTVPAKSITDADAIGARPNRPSWCKGCKAAAAASQGATRA